MPTEDEILAAGANQPADIERDAMLARALAERQRLLDGIQARAAARAFDYARNYNEIEPDILQAFALHQSRGFSHAILESNARTGGKIVRAMHAAVYDLRRKALCSVHATYPEATAWVRAQGGSYVLRADERAQAVKYGEF